MYRVAHVLGLAALWLYGNRCATVPPGGGSDARGGGEGGMARAAALIPTAYLTTLVVLIHPALYSVSGYGSCYRANHRAGHTVSRGSHTSDGYHRRVPTTSGTVTYLWPVT